MVTIYVIVHKYGCKENGEIGSHVFINIRNVHLPIVGQK